MGHKLTAAWMWVLALALLVCCAPTSQPTVDAGPEASASIVSSAPTASPAERTLGSEYNWISPPGDAGTVPLSNGQGVLAGWGTPTASQLGLAFTSAQVDANSLVWSRQDGPESHINQWSANSSLNYRFQSATNGDMTWINQGANAAALGISAQMFVMPPGATAITAGFSYIQDGTHTPQPFTWCIHNGTTCSVTSASLTPGASLTPTTLTLGSMTPGAKYYLVIFANNTPQSSFLVSGIYVNQTGGTGVFASNFVRKRIDASDYQRDAFSGTGAYVWHATGFVHTASPFSYVEYLTDATTIGADVWSDLTQATRGFRVDVNGSFNQYVQPSSGGVGAQFLTFTLPAGMKRVRITTGTNANATGSWLRALYLPATAQFQVPPREPKPLRRVLFYGDSIPVGTTSSLSTSVGDRTAPNLVGDTGLIEPWFWAHGGWALTQDVTTQAQANALVQSWPAGMTDIWLEMVANDYLSATCTSANFQIYYGYLLSAIATYYPGAHVYAQSALPETVETANGAGSTLPNYRTAIQNACAQYSCTFVDGTSFGIVTGTDLNGDGVHPNDLGHAKWASVGIVPSLTSSSSTYYSISAPNLQWAPGITAPTISQASTSTQTTGAAMTFQSQQSTQATNNANGPYIFNLQIPHGTGVEGSLQLQRAGNTYPSFVVQPYNGAGSTITQVCLDPEYACSNTTYNFEAGNAGNAFFNAAYGPMYFRIGNATVVTYTASEIQPVSTNTVALGDSTTAFKASFINGIDTDTTNTTLPIGGTNATAINVGHGTSMTVQVSGAELRPGTDLALTIGDGSHRLANVYDQGGIIGGSQSASIAAADMHIQPELSTHATNWSGGNLYVDLQTPGGSGS